MAAEHMLILTGVGTIGVVLSTAIVKFFVSRKEGGSNVTKSRPFNRCKCSRNRAREDLVSKTESASATSSDTTEYPQPRHLATDDSNTKPSTIYHQQKNGSDNNSSTQLPCSISPKRTSNTGKKRVTFSQPLSMTPPRNNSSQKSGVPFNARSSQGSDTESSGKLCIQSEPREIERWTEATEEVNEVLVDMDVTTVSIAVPNMKRSNSLTFNTMRDEAMTEAVADLIFSDSWNRKNNSDQKSEAEAQTRNSTNCINQTVQTDQSESYDSQELQASSHNALVSHQESGTSLLGTSNDGNEPETHDLSQEKSLSLFEAPYGNNQQQGNVRNVASLIDKYEKSDEPCRTKVNGNSLKQKIAEKSENATKNVDEKPIGFPQVNGVGCGTHTRAFMGDVQLKCEGIATEENTNSEEITPQFRKSSPDVNASSSNRESHDLEKQKDPIYRIAKAEELTENSIDDGVSTNLPESRNIHATNSSMNANKENRIAVPSPIRSRKRKVRAFNGGTQALNANSSQKYLALIKPVLSKRGSFSEDPRPKTARPKRKLFAQNKKLGSTKLPFHNPEAAQRTKTITPLPIEDSSGTNSRKGEVRAAPARSNAGEIRRVRVVEVPVEAVPSATQMQLVGSGKIASVTDCNVQGRVCESSSFFRKGKHGGLGILRRKRGTVQNETNTDQIERANGNTGFTKKLSRRLRDRIRTMASKV